MLTGSNKRILYPVEEGALIALDKQEGFYVRHQCWSYQRYHRGNVCSNNTKHLFTRRLGFNVVWMIGCGCVTLGVW